MLKRTIFSSIAIILLISACGAPTAIPAPTPANPAVAPTVRQDLLTAAGVAYHRQGPGVIVLSLGGARADLIDQYLSDGLMPNLARLAENGVKAQYAQSVDPPLSTPAHASISSGCFPDKTGIIADKYHSPQDNFTQYVSSLDEPEMAVEPVWRTAMRYGLRTAAVFWPGAGLNLPEQSALRQPFGFAQGRAQDTADYTVAYGESDVPSAQHTITFTVANGWENPPHSFSPLQEGLLRITSHEDALVSAINVLAVDTRDDGIANYETFYLCRFKEMDEDSAPLVEGQWAPVTVSPHLRSGAYFKITASNLTSLTNPLSLTVPISLTVFQSQVSYNQASPVELLREVSELFGFFPPPPDHHALQQGWITPEDYLAMAETQSRWMMEVAIHIYTAHQPDLMLTGQSSLSEIVRQFLLVEERQSGYSPELAEEYAGYRERGAQIADASLGQLLAAIDLKDTTILVVSDHGLAPVHTVVHLNIILEQAGFLSFRESPGFPTALLRRFDATSSKALALTSGGSAHIYVNLRGREQPGVVLQEEYPALLDELVRTLSEVRDPNGQPVFARIVRRQEMGGLHLSSPYSGDLFVQAEPGYVLSDEWGKEEVFEPTSHHGGAGYDSALGEMHGIFVAAGRGVREGETISPVRLVDIAPTVARLLGFSPAEIVDGLALDEIMR